ncbi:MAG TPA: 1-deoxy-D-xylulose-5-phosphate synthase [Phycisphaerae bacterium]|nr:1-deoxy-D-xylulose-5-phosphate synthase [Phycisphaerales bacterium]HRX83426.1 1-deoxy-D-xylulose-5-phosphate synthase [Phycisphaerae bacterium]
MKPRIMYVEHKGDGLSGTARIGRVSFSATGRTFYYRGMALRKIKGYKRNCVDVATGIGYWISGCKRSGGDRLYPGVIEIDDDVREEYWTQIRNQPECRDQTTIRCVGKYGGR